MKICFLAAANSIHSHKWINFFVELGHEVTWISLVSSSVDIPNNVNYFEVGSRNKFFGIFSAIIKSRKIISEFSPDAHLLSEYKNCIIEYDVNKVSSWHQILDHEWYFHTKVKTSLCNIYKSAFI